MDPHSFNQSQWELEDDLNELDALPFNPWQILLIVLYSTTALISLSSNVLTIVILFRGEHVSTELWKFLFNLSIADISMAIFCIPFTYTNYMLGHWIFPHFLCSIINHIQALSVAVSVWTLTAIGIDRYFAIIYPFRQLLWIKRHKIITIVVIWIFSFLIALPMLLAYKVKSFILPKTGERFYECTEELSENSAKAYTIFLFLFTFFIPITVLIFAYSRICIHLLRHCPAPGNPDPNRDRVCINNKIKVIKMLLTIVLLFAVCWFPLHIYQFLVYFYSDFMKQRYKDWKYYLKVGSYFVVHWMAMAHSLVNPFVYCFMSDNFRQGFRKMLLNCFHRLDHFEQGEDLTVTQIQSVTLIMTTVQKESKMVRINSKTSNITEPKTQLLEYNGDTLNEGDTNDHYV